METWLQFKPKNVSYDVYQTLILVTWLQLSVKKYMFLSIGGSFDRVQLVASKNEWFETSMNKPRYHRP